jgi:hypothetical protein
VAGLPLGFTSFHPMFLIAAPICAAYFFSFGPNGIIYINGVPFLFYAAAEVRRQAQ